MIFEEWRTRGQTLFIQLAYDEKELIVGMSALRIWVCCYDSIKPCDQSLRMLTY